MLHCCLIILIIVKRSSCLQSEWLLLIYTGHNLASLPALACDHAWHFLDWGHWSMKTHPPTGHPIQGPAWIKEQARKQSRAERERSCPCAAGQQFSKAPVLRYQPHDRLCPHAEPKSTFFPWGVFFKYLTQVGRKVLNMAFLMANWENRDKILKLLTRINLSGSILSNLSVQVLPRHHRV